MSHWEKKMRRLFTSWDTDKNGVLEENDFTLWVDRINQSYPSATEEEKKFYREAIMGLWIDFANGGKNPAQGTAVTFEQYTEAMQVKAKSATLPKDLEPIAKAAFDRMDVDREGVIKREEYIKVLTLMPNTTATIAEEAFIALDKNGDGVIDYGELHAAWIFFVEDENDTSNPLNNIFGKL